MAEEQPPSPPPTAPTPQDQLLAQYEVPDHGFDPEADLAPEPAPPAEPPAASPPRDPGTGRFVPQKPAPSGRVRRMAEDFGLSPQEIDEYTPDQLEAVVYDRHRRRLSPPTQPSERPAPAAAAPPAPAEEPAVDLGLADEEQYDPHLLAGLKKVLGDQAKRIRQLEQAAQFFLSREQEREHQTVTERLDARFAKRPDLFGEGKLHDLTPDGNELQRRRAVVWAMEQLKEGSIEDRFDKAMNVLYGKSAGSTETPVSVATPPANGTLDLLGERRQAWAEGGVQRPTYRDTKEPKGEKRAVKAVAAKMREMGMVDAEGREELGLPD